MSQFQPHISRKRFTYLMLRITKQEASLGTKLVEVMEFQLSYFKSLLKDDAVKVLHSICQQIWKTQQWPQNCKRSVCIPISKKGNAKECSVDRHSLNVL